MDLQKYRNDGWGLSVLGFKLLLDNITENPKDKLKILEFGSGTSTKFFCDVVINKIKDLEITSFDNSPKFSYKPNPEEIFLDLKIRTLVGCSDEDYQKQFLNKTYQENLMYDKGFDVNLYVRNCFYTLSEGDLNGVYDIVVVDGPHGNGRNFSFLHIKNFVAKGTIIYIDDYNHYDFLEKATDILNCEVIYKHTEGIGSDNFVIVKII